MATSGTYTFNLDVDTIIQEASELIGGDTVLGNEVTSAKRSINLLLTDWQNRNINLWTVNTTVISVTTSVTSYALTNSTIDILEAVVTRDDRDLGMTRISMEEYLNINNKSQTGRPSQYAIRRGRDYPELFLYPIPENSTDTLKLEQIHKIQDVENIISENVDVPTRFLPCLTMGLAYYMSMKRPNVVGERIALLKQNYEELLSNAQLEDRERTSLFFKPKLSRV
jgi:hypothetical protein|tara:strand:- start:475 stop:1149 length:675 start_codon:yes stop_codon:yes gene_type:complete